MNAGKTYFVRNNRGASTQYKLSDLKSPSKWKIIENARYFYASGFSLKNYFDAIQEISKHAAENNKVCDFGMYSVFPYNVFNIPTSLYKDLRYQFEFS
jgi:adenosine kinase